MSTQSVQNEANFQASATALETLTSNAASNKLNDPKTHIHIPSNHPENKPWLARFFPHGMLDSIEAKNHMGNYVLDRATGDKSFEAMSMYVRMGMHLLYYGSSQEYVLHWPRALALLKAQSEKMGKEYDDPASVAHIQPFIDSFDLQSSMAEMVLPDPTQYPTFNAFFAREIREDARPVAEPNNPAATSSPADCRLTAFPTIDLATKYWIKGFGFSLERLLGGAELASAFDGGSMVIARLAPQDYHRWHSPISGKVMGVTEIPGAYYTVNPQAINEPGTLDVFCENRRSVMTMVEAGSGSPVAVVAVGAMLVGSIRYVEGVETPGARVRRGECLGYFMYGGSTVIVVYPKGRVLLDEDLVENSTGKGCETLMKVGWRTGLFGT